MRLLPKSFYPRIILMLSAVFLLLFAILGSGISLLIKYRINETVIGMQSQRAVDLFQEINKLPAEDDSGLTTLLNSHFPELQVDLFGRDNLWRIGNQHNFAARDSLMAADFQSEHQLVGFSALYENPDAQSPYRYLRLAWRSPGESILLRILSLFAIAGVIIVFVAALLGWAMSAYLNRRLLQLQRAVAAVSAGNYEVDLLISGEDEIADLAGNFRRMSLQIKDLIARLEESNTARQRLIAHASHEIKSPLTAIKGFVDIIDYLKVLPEEEREKLLPAVKTDILRAIKISDDMLQLARLKEPAYQLEITSLEIGEFLTENHRYFTEKAQRNNVRAELEIPSEEDEIFIETDPQRLSQILENIWGNALKYGDKSYPVKTRYSRSTRTIMLEVENHLRSPLDVPAAQLLEPFYRHPSTAGGIKGSGLGLAIVQELVSRLGGKLDISAADKELSLRISLPETQPVISKKERVADERP